MPAGGCGDKKVYIKASGDFWKEKICLLLTYKENVHSTQMYIPLKPLFSRHKGIGVQFTDEPTGNLDSRTTADVMGVLRESSRKYNQTILMVTHNEILAQSCQRLIHMEDGQIVGEEFEETPAGRWDGETV